MANMLDALGLMFEEDLVPGVEDYHPQLDRAYSQVVKSNERVLYDALTKDYKAIHTFVLAAAGALRSANTGGPSMVADTTATHLISAHETYPGVQDSPLPGVAQRALTITKLKGTIVLNLENLRMNQLHTVDDYPAMTFSQFAKGMAHQMAVSWYLNDSGQVIALDADNANWTLVRNSAHVVTVSVSTGSDPVLVDGPFRRLMPGLQYDLWLADATMSVCYTKAGWCMLDDQVDFYNPQSIKLFFQDSTDADAFAAAAPTGGALANEVWMVPYSAIEDKTAAGLHLSRLPCGFKSWMKNDATRIFGIFGSATILGNSYGSMFKSLLKSLGGSLSEGVLNTYLADFKRATGVELDSILMTNGILVNMLEATGMDAGTSFVRIERQGEAQKVELGWDYLRYRFDGRLFDLITSDFLTSGEVAVVKLRDGNLLRYEPPSIPGSLGAQTGTDPRIEWLGKQFSDRIWLPSTAPGGGVTNGIQAPFDLLFNHAAKEVRGILFSSVDENTPTY